MELKELKREDLNGAFGKDESEMEDALWLILRKAVELESTDIRALRMSTVLAGIGSSASMGILRMLGMNNPRYLILDRAMPKTPLAPTEALANLVANLFKKPIRFVDGGPLHGQIVMLAPNVRGVSVECVGESRAARYRVIGDEARYQS